MFPIFPEPSDEQKAEHAKAVEEYRARIQNNTHRVKHFMDELDAEGLECLSIILSNCDTSENLNFYQGRIHGMLEVKFGRCTCGKDHQAEFDDFLKERESEKQDPAVEAAAQQDEAAAIERLKAQGYADRGEVADALDKAVEEHPLVRAEAEAGPDLTENDVYLKVCEDYGVRPKGNGKATVICLGCGIENPSLQDRMLREPGIDGCSGCQQKSAHG